MSKLIKKIKNPSSLLVRLRWELTKRGYYNSWSDEKYLLHKYKIKFKRKLDLNNPKLFTEKLQWLKINDRKSLYTQMVDKYEAKKYIKDIVGDKYNVPTYGIYEKFSDINFDEIPDKFVMKCTHNSGGTVICTNKNEFKKEEANKKISKNLEYSHYYSGREWPYKNVKPRIIIEKLLQNDDKSEVVEYNFFCFNGEPKLVMTCSGDKRIKRYNDFYDMNFKKIELKCEYDNSDVIYQKPKQFDKMVELSKKLSAKIPHLRVDLYVCNDKIYVGELTFYHWSGFCKFEPEEWDRKMGEWLDLKK